MAGLSGWSSGIPASTFPTKSAPTSAPLVNIPPPSLAKIENELGVKATYFLKLHSEFYNLFEKSIFEKVLKIIEFGHNIGLHFEHHYN